MVRKKPFVIYLPDEKDPTVYRIYTRDYYKIIKNMMEGKIKIENKCSSIEETVDKIIYYINNNFSLDEKLEQFYQNFNLTAGNNVQTFIDYLHNLN